MKISEIPTKWGFGSIRSLYLGDDGRQAGQKSAVQIKDGVVVGADIPALPAEALPAKEGEQTEPEIQPEEEPAVVDLLAEDDPPGGRKPIRPGRLPRIEHYFTALKSENRSSRTIKEYQWEWRWWQRKAHTKGVSPYLLTVADVESFTADLHPATARRKICFLRSLSKFYLKRGNFKKLSDELAKLGTIKLPARLPKDRGGEAFIELREQAKAWCRENKRIGIWTGGQLLCGLRISELASIERTGKTNIRVLGKGNKERIVPAPEWLLLALETVPKDGKGGWARSRFLIWKTLKNHGIKNPHSLRHTFASELLRRGKPIEQVQQLLGHASIATTQIYTHVAQVPDVVATLESEKEG